MRRLTVLWLVILVILPLRSGAEKSRNGDMNNGNGRNHLADASSPYLLSHADNPVDWYQWGEEAFIKARKEDKPIFLSIGYNACHWCHVMEHESFENDSIADFLNANFVSIKVDREERPDIDQIYMSAVTAMTGSGGWPMTIFMTPDRKPFFAGTYFPPQARYGRPGFMEVIKELSNIYQTDRDKINSTAGSVVEHIASGWQEKIPFREISEDVLLSAADIYYSGFDNQYGGFGQAPKFPQGTNVSLLMRAFHLSGKTKYKDAAFTTLQKMAEGGIFDHLGGGFHRYSTDRQWLTPHFEKMLYDNALLVIPYLEAYQLSGEKQYIDVVNSVLEYLQLQMTDIEGGFYSTQDADSEGEEGKFYTWEKDEIDAVLEPGDEWFLNYYNITERGNFEDKRNILHTGRHSERARAESGLSAYSFTAKLHEIKKRLFEIRQKRIAPATDDKILASWNGLAISAFSNAYLVTGKDSYLESARRGADFVLDKMSRGDTLYHSYRAGRLLRVELLEDYAYFTAGLIDLYQATFSEKYLEKAIAFSKRAISLFSSDDIFYMSPAGNDELIVRPRDLTDGATPSPASIMIIDLLKLAVLSGDNFLRQKGEASLKAVSGLASRSPQAVASLLLAGDFNYAERVEIVIVGPDSEKRKEFNRVLFANYMPNTIIVGAEIGGQSDLPLLQGRLEVKELTYYFCKNNSCRLPVSDKNSLKSELEYILSGTGPKSN